MHSIAIANEQTTLALDEDRLRQAVTWILTEAKIAEATISLAVVDDPTIHELNREYLQHDYATDVLSFLLERDATSLEGEVIVSADTATTRAEDYGWSAHDELLLYVVHGTLHLVGYDDGLSQARREMRRQERACLAQFGLVHRWKEERDEKEAPAARRRRRAPGGKQPS